MISLDFIFNSLIVFRAAHGFATSASNNQDNALDGYIKQSDLSKATFINYK